MRLWSLTGLAEQEGMPGIQEETLDGQPLATLEGHAGAVCGISLNADGRLLASGGQDATVRLWKTRTGVLLMTLQGHTGAVWGVSLSADGRLLASGGFDGEVRLWDANEGRLLARLQGHAGTVWGVSLSADGRLLVSGGMDGTVRLWSLADLRPVKERCSECRACRVNGRWPRSRGTPVVCGA